MGKTPLIPEHGDRLRSIGLAAQTADDFCQQCAKSVTTNEEVAEIRQRVADRKARGEVVRK